MKWLLIPFTIAVPAFAAPPEEGFRAGAARVDITPREGSALAMSGYANRTEPFQKIHDRLYARAIAVSDAAGAQAAIIACDLIGFSHALWERLAGRISAASGIPLDHILLAATHTHGGPALGNYPSEPPSEERAAYLKELEEKLAAVAVEAKANLRPARLGFGTGKASVNINRRARMAAGDWWLGLNPDGPSDKTVAVLKFESLDGEPFALLINYPVHGTVLGPRNLSITADLPGATSRFVEQHYGDRLVAVWTAGASGDQDPIYRVGTDFDQCAALGRILGEEVLRVVAAARAIPAGRVTAAQRVVTCPGKRSPGGVRRQPDGIYEFADADPVDIRLSLLRLHQTAIAGVSGEVLTGIGERLKAESPFTRTILVTHANGSSGYLPDDAAYDRVSYEIVASRVKRGCAENAIVGGLLELISNQP
jgi:neutral ceramidase